jgi:hypothetical protein
MVGFLAAHQIRPIVDLTKQPTIAASLPQGARPGDFPLRVFLVVLREIIVDDWTFAVFAERGDASASRRPGEDKRGTPYP